MIKVALTNLGKYNEGELVYTWLELPASDEEIEEALDEIGIDGEEYEEYFITDYEFDGEIRFDIREYSSLSQLNEIAEKLDELDDEELYAIQAYMEMYGSNVDFVLDAIKFTKDGNFHILYNCNNIEDVAYYYINESGIYDLPEIAKTYFNYKAFGRDLEIEGSFIFLDNGVCVEFFN